MAKKKKIESRPVKAEAVIQKPATLTKETRIKWQFMLLALVLTLISLWPVLNNGFINFDDPQYVTENPVVQKLSTENIKLFFTQQFVGNYQPIVMLSYALQFRFFGMYAEWYHLFSLFFHLLNTALVYIVIFHLLRNNMAALITALLFGMHTLHVESIAWVASQKDVLYTFFFMGVIYFYIKQKETKGNALKFVLPALLLFVFSVLCKAQAVVLPMVLLLVDYWQKKTITMKMVVQKIPYFIIAILAGLLAVMMQKKAGAVQDYAYFSVLERILFSSFGFVNYLWQTILPIKLSIFYPYPETHDKINTGWVYAAPVIILVLAAVVFWVRKRSPITVFGVLFFCVTIALVIQLIPVGDAIRADRYTYISLIGFFIIAGYYFGKYFEEKKNSRPVLIGGAVAYFIFLGSLTFLQSQKWKDSVSIYSASIVHHPAPIMYCNRGAELFKQEKYKEAWDDFNDAAIMRPRFPNVFKNRALTYEKLGDVKSAIPDYTSALRYNKNDLTLYLYRGNAYKNLNQFDSAIADFNTIVARVPDMTEAYYSRAEAYGRSGKLKEALADFDMVIAKKPDADAAYNNRGIVHSMTGDHVGAINDFSKAIQLNPKFWNAYYNRAVSYQKIRDFKNAYADIAIAKNNGYPVDERFVKELQTMSGN